MGSERRKLVVIGLDGASFDVLGPYIKAGLLPSFARLMREGAWGPLRSTTPPVTGPAWTSFMTGVSPGKHGVFDFVKRVEGSISRQPITTRDFQEPTVWQYLTKAGKKVGLVNIPITYPPPRVDGFAIPGMLTPVTEGEYAHPHGLMGELNQAVGGYVHDVPWQLYTRAGLAGAERFLEDLMRCTEQRIQSLLYLMEAKEWDVFMGVFTETDRVQHFLWRFIHPASVEGMSERERAVVAKVEGFYRRLDGFFGELLQRIEGKADLLVVSDHGFGPLDGTLYINRWLETRGHLVVRWGKVRMIYLKRWVFRMIRGLLGARDGNELRRKLGMQARENNASRMGTYFFLRHINWGRTSAYSVSRAEQGVYVNLRGREPNGSVEAGAEYERVREAVLKDLRELRDPVSGRPLPVYLARREELYQGPHVGNAPDIVALVGDGRYLLDVKLTRRVFEPSGWISGTGSHRFEGVLIGWGEGFARGKELRDARIIDMTPTILSHQGLPIPQYMDGKPLQDLYGEEHRKAHAPVYSRDGRLPPEKDEEGPLSQEDVARVEARLKGLGYM